MKWPVLKIEINLDPEKTGQENADMARIVLGNIDVQLEKFGLPKPLERPAWTAGRDFPVGHSKVVMRKDT